MNRPPRRRRLPALLRGRFRTLFFLLLAVAALALGHHSAAIVAALGALAGAASVGVARQRGEDRSHAFAFLDWLLLGVTLTLAGSTASWLLAGVPVLAMGQLCMAPRSDWPYLLAPTLVLPVVLVIADPSLGGHRAAGLLELVVLVSGGVVAAARLRRGPARRPTAPKVDAATGFYTAARLPALLGALMEDALEQHQPLSVVHLRLEHFQDACNFLGQAGSEALILGVARRAGRRLAGDDLAFRLQADAFALVLPGRTAAEAQAVAAAVAHDVSANLIGGRRQTLATGVASFPPLTGLDELLAAARLGAVPVTGRALAAGAMPAAVAQ